MTNKTITLSREAVEVEAYLVRSKEEPKHRGVRLFVDQSCYDTNTETLPLMTVAQHERIIAALAEPVPPAGGEAEVLAWLVRDSRDGQFSAHRNDPTGWAHGYQVTELVDRANVTRLQAEVEHWRNRSAQWKERVAELTNEGNSLNEELVRRAGAIGSLAGERSTLQSELTKARELLAERPSLSLSKADLVVLNGLVAKNYQNARRLCQRASTPMKSAEAQAKLKLAEDLMHALSNQSAPADKGRGETVHECQKCWGRGVIPTRLSGEGETEYRNRCKSYAEQPAPVAVVDELEAFKAYMAANPMATYWSTWQARAAKDGE